MQSSAYCTVLTVFVGNPNPSLSSQLVDEFEDLTSQLQEQKLKMRLGNRVVCLLSWSPAQKGDHYFIRFQR